MFLAFDGEECFELLGVKVSRIFDEKRVLSIGIVTSSCWIHLITD